MASRIVIDGNAFYEIDEDCMKRKREKQSKEQADRQNGQAQKSRECGIRGEKGRQLKMHGTGRTAIENT